MTCRARQAVLACESGDGVRRPYDRQEDPQCQQLRTDCFQSFHSYFFSAFPSRSKTLLEEAQCFVGYKLVAHPVNSSKVDWVLRIVLDLLPQFRDAIIDGAVAGPLPFWPDGAYQPSARNDDFWPQNQELQHLELSKCQADRLIATTEFHFFEIQGDLAEPRNLTNSVDLRICHVQLCDCRGINVVA